MAFETIALDSQGMVHMADIFMGPSWDVRAFSKTDGHVLGDLSLSCAFPWGQDAIYLFSSISRTEPPLESLPSLVAEVLLFPPVVPLKWQQGGFQALTPSEWEALVITELADRPPTCASVPLRMPGDEAVAIWDYDDNMRGGTVISDEDVNDTTSIESTDEDDSVQEVPPEEEDNEDNGSVASYCSGASD